MHNCSDVEGSSFGIAGVFKDMKLRTFDELREEQNDNDEEEVEIDAIAEFTETMKETMKEKQAIAACDSSHKGQCMGGTCIISDS